MEKLIYQSANLNKSSNNPLNSNVNADWTKKITTLNDNIYLMEEDGNEDNPAKGELEVGKFSDTSKVDHLLSSESYLKKVPHGEKENIYFIIDNRSNIINRTMKSVVFVMIAVIGTRLQVPHQNPIIYYVQIVISRKHFYKGQFCNHSRVKGEHEHIERKSVGCSNSKDLDQKSVSSFKADFDSP
ncbi:hypothetical protein CHS0354_023427 [Potamilus streckersoni]|uniref:Uncharacterized protein n=1 Tax=Potamilus streckersoni TaxID=2493646 RepID=A0AAE0RYJ9_9BIVA|nr:hypothetical protein CHS0354_023427 [Potamilus streckersoni]